MADHPSLSPTKPNNEPNVEKEADHPSLSPTKPNGKEADYPSLSPTKPNGKEADYPSLSPTKPNVKEADYPSLSPTKPNGEEAHNPSLSPTKPNGKEDLEKEVDYPFLSPTLPNNEAEFEKQPKSTLSPTKSNNEEDIAKERVREIVSSLPKEMGWANQYLYNYQGFWHSYPALEGIVYAQKNVKPEASDIVLATSLKCGTTWLKALVFSIKNREIYQNSSSTQKLPHPLLTNHPHVLVRGIDYMPSHKYIPYKTFPSLDLIGTHMSYNSLPESIRTSGCRIVYMCRDPKDVFVSMWNFYKNVRKDATPIPLQEAFELFCNGVNLTGPYWDHVLEYYKASLEQPERVLFLRYEDMQRDTLYHVRRMAEFIGYPFTLEEETKGVDQDIVQLCSFKNMSSSDAAKSGKLFGQVSNDVWFRKGKVGDSKSSLTTEMVDRLNQITKEKFQGFEIGY